MKIIHHKLENGLEDPIEVEFKQERDTQYPSDVLSDALEYLSDAMKDDSFSHPMYGLNFTETENHTSKVFLITSGDDDIERAEVIVSNKPAEILNAYRRFVAPSDGSGFPCNIIHLQEFDSFESAYAVALAMREGHPLCYPQE